MTNADLVHDFHRAIGDDYPRRPRVPERRLLDLRQALLREEAEEAMAEFDRLRERIGRGESLDAVDLTPLAHELVDLLYVTYGALAAMGIPADAVFAEVHRANLAKTSGPRRADGKQLKPDGWTPADVRAVLDEAVQRPL